MYHGHHDPTAPKKYGAMAHQEEMLYHGGSHDAQGSSSPHEMYKKEQMYNANTQDKLDSGYHLKEKEDEKTKEKDSSPSIDDHIDAGKKYESHKDDESIKPSPPTPHPQDSHHVGNHAALEAPEKEPPMDQFLKSVDEIILEMSKPSIEVINLDRKKNFKKPR